MAIEVYNIGAAVTTSNTVDLPGGICDAVWVGGAGAATGGRILHVITRLRSFPVPVPTDLLRLRGKAWRVNACVLSSWVTPTQPQSQAPCPSRGNVTVSRGFADGLGQHSVPTASRLGISHRLTRRRVPSWGYLTSRDRAVPMGSGLKTAGVTPLLRRDSN